MRLLSFLTQVEATFSMLRPEDGPGWLRRVDYQTGEASAWHAGIGLSLHLRVSAVSERSHGVHARWTGPTGEVLVEKTFFCGPAAHEWQTAADTLAELAPAAPPPRSSEHDLPAAMTARA